MECLVNMEIKIKSNDNYDLVRIFKDYGIFESERFEIRRKDGTLKGEYVGGYVGVKQEYVELIFEKYYGDSEF